MYHNKYMKYKNKYLMLRAKNIDYYYYASSTKLDMLVPQRSRAMDNEEVVFATNTKWLAIFFLAGSPNDAIELGLIDNKPYILEQYPDTFDIFLKNKSGYLHYLDAANFQSDPRISMKYHVFISRNEEKILKTETISDIYEALKNSPVTIISFNDKMEWLEKLMK